MSDLSYFLKKNKIEKKNTFYPATKTLRDENGEPLMWEIRALTAKETAAIRQKATIEVPITGKPGAYSYQTDLVKFQIDMMAESIVFPDLYNAELQNSYGVKTPQDLLYEMVDDPVEFNRFSEFINHFNGVDESLEEKVESSKN